MNAFCLSASALLFISTAAIAHAADADAGDELLVIGQRQAYRREFTLKQTTQAIQLIGECQTDNNIPG